MSGPRDPWASCECGHIWITHDIDEFVGDGSDLCCVPDCDQCGCPGQATPDTPTTRGYDYDTEGFGGT